MEIILQFVLLVIGFVLLMKGADWFVDGASKIADKFGIPHIVIGLTIVAFGTSAPEAAVSIGAALKGSVGLAVSNVVGSNIMNVLLILGLSSVIYPLAVKKSTIQVDIPFVFAVSVLLLFFGVSDGMIGRIDGLIFLALIIGYVLYMIHFTKKSQTSDDSFEPANADDKVWKLLLLIILGGVMIVAGSNVTVDAASSIATKFGMDDWLIGLTIVAFGTSLPELVTSCIAAKKKETDIAVGNIVGSNLFNILFVLGTSAVITPIEYKSEFVFDSVVAALVMVVLWLLVFRKQRLSRMGGVIMLALYAAYFAHLLFQALNPAAMQ